MEPGLVATAIIGGDKSLMDIVFFCSVGMAVTALVNLYAALQFPSQLSNWNSNGGDPCTQSWFGVVCSGANVTQLYVKSISSILHSLFALVF